MSEASDPPVVEYGQSRKRSRLWIFTLIIVVAAGVGVFFGRDFIRQEYQRRVAFNSLFHTTLPTRRYIMNDPSDANGKIDQMRSDWLIRNGSFVVSNALFRDMNLCNSGGRVGVQSMDIMRYPVFIGEVRSPAGHRRLMLVNFGREGYEGPAESVAVPHMICQLYSFGSLMNPTITPVPIKPSADPATQKASNIRGNWQVIVFSRVSRATKVETTSGSLNATNPAQVRVPVWFDGQADQLLIDLQDDDSIVAKPASGGELPWRVNLPAPTTNQ